MQKRKFQQFALAVLIALASAGSLWAVDPMPTTITIPDMECKGCATKVTNSLMAVSGVAQVQTDLKARTVVVKPKPNLVLSPKAMWESLEKVDKAPSKLVGPSGTFTSKPQK